MNLQAEHWRSSTPQPVRYCIYTALPQTLLKPSWQYWKKKRDYNLFVYLIIYLASLWQKTQRCPFIFNEPRCGPAGVVATTISADFFFNLFPLDSTLETSVWSWGRFSFAAVCVWLRLPIMSAGDQTPKRTQRTAQVDIKTWWSDSNANRVKYTSQHHTRQTTRLSVTQRALLC